MCEYDSVSSCDAPFQKSAMSMSVSCAPQPDLGVAVLTDAPALGPLAKEQAAPRTTPIDLSPHKTAKARLARIFNKKKRVAYRELQNAAKLEDGQRGMRE